MVGKRFLLIAGGTVGGLGAVLSITPPQIGSSGGLVIPGGLSSSGTTLTLPTTTPSAATPPVTSTPTASTPTPTATKKTKKPTPKKTKVAATKTRAPISTPVKSTPTPVKSTPTPIPVKSTPTPTPVAAGVSGTFTGASANTRFGPVEVQITVVNNKITNAVALVYPVESFRDQQINQQAIPYLIEETLSAQSANIQGVGGASFTSQGWINSLQSAITKAKI